MSLRAIRLPFYAVVHGRKPGIYNSAASCQRQVKGFDGAVYAKLPTHKAAEQFMEDFAHTAKVKNIPNLFLANPFIKIKPDAPKDDNVTH